MSKDNFIWFDSDPDMSIGKGKTKFDSIPGNGKPWDSDPLIEIIGFKKGPTPDIEETPSDIKSIAGDNAPLPSESIERGASVKITTISPAGTEAFWKGYKASLPYPTGATVEVFNPGRKKPAKTFTAK